MSSEHDETRSARPATRAAPPRGSAKTGAAGKAQAAAAPPGKASQKDGPARRGGRFTQSRREEIVQKAARLFIERGYDEVTIDDIVAEIGGSKATVYSRFGGKAGLFTAVIEEYCEAISQGIEVELDLSGSLEEQLGSIGRTFLQLILREQTLELHRLIVSISERFPGIAKTFFDAGPGSAYRLMSAWVKRQQRAGTLAGGDPEELAILFLDMLTARHQLTRLLGIEPAADAAQVERTVGLAVAVFLGGTRASAPDA